MCYPCKKPTKMAADATRRVAGDVFSRSKPETFRTNDGEVIVEDELLTLLR